MKTLELVTFDLVSWMHVADEVDDGDDDGDADHNHDHDDGPRKAGR